MPNKGPKLQPTFRIAWRHDGLVQPQLRAIHLQFALIATSRLKPDKVLKVISVCLDKGRTRSAFSMLVEIAICLPIVYRMATF